MESVTCPCCDGTGESPKLLMHCLWCRRSGSVTPQTALRYRRQAAALTEGGYLNGEYTLDELFAERARLKRAEVEYAPKVQPDA